MLIVPIRRSIRCCRNIWIVSMRCCGTAIPPITLWRNACAYIIGNPARYIFRIIFVNISMKVLRHDQPNKFKKTNPYCPKYYQKHKPVVMEKSIKNEEYYKIYPEQKKYQKGNNAPLVMFFRLLFFAHLSVQKLLNLITNTLSLTNFRHLNQSESNVSS